MDEQLALKLFPMHERACLCCGAAEIDPAFMERLVTARLDAGIPFPITSMYRCPAHNREVGSTSDNHPAGKAADIGCDDPRSRFIIVAALIRAGFTRIGIARTFIHCDTMDDAGKAPDVIWLYER
jgi:zinc D-Ala-D-Ala carboxypeptidase